jgi:ABC-type antimicrobial peptide transport system permease subunit
MTKLNSKQQIILVLSIIIFLILNFYALSLVFAQDTNVLGAADSAGTETKIIDDMVKTKSRTWKNLKSKPETADYDLNKTAYLNDGMTEVAIADLGVIYSTTPSVVYFGGNELTAEGELYIVVKKSFYLSIDDAEILLSPGLRAIYQSDANKLIVLSGEQKIDYKKIRKNNYIEWSSGGIKIDSTTIKEITANEDLETLLNFVEVAE